MFKCGLAWSLQAMIRNLWFGETIKEAIDSPRFHHQLFPMEFSFERGFPEASYLYSNLLLNILNSLFAKNSLFLKLNR